jgi:hypothetical protein
MSDRDTAITTDLDAVLAEPSTFWLGEVIGDYEVGPYQIIEYYQWERRGCEVLVGSVDYDARFYSGYINGKAIGRSWSTLDAALAGLIAIRQEGPNSQAGMYFIRMLKASD